MKLNFCKKKIVYNIMEFNYIIEKIKNAEIIHHPFPHLDIKDFYQKNIYN